MSVFLELVIEVIEVTSAGGSHSDTTDVSHHGNGVFIFKVADFRFRETSTSFEILIIDVIGRRHLFRCWLFDGFLRRGTGIRTMDCYGCLYMYIREISP